MGDHHYFGLLQSLHKQLKPKTYLEIGTESGASLWLSECFSIAVDPSFNFAADMTTEKPSIFLYQGTSDDFFASDELARLSPEVDFAFLDGMHLMEFLLRDFINTEKMMSPDGVIGMHDCVPFNYVAAERVWRRRITKSWVGDVWKLIPILKQYRPDLKIEVMNARPSGLCLVHGLDPQSTVLSDVYDDILSQWLDVSLNDYGLDQLSETMGLCEYDPETFNWLEYSSKTNRTYQIIIQTPVPAPPRKKFWGDWHFASSMAHALRKRGHEVQVNCLSEFKPRPDFGDVHISLRGKRSYPVENKINFDWVLYPGKSLEDAESILNEQHRAEFSFVASEDFTTKLKAAGKPAACLPQAFDADVMKPETNFTDDLVIVANNHAWEGALMRPIAQMAVDAGLSPKVFGKSWENTALSTCVVERVLPNDRLGQIYGSALAVLCDSLPSMQEHGFISNRFYDVLATGRPIISTPVSNLPSEFEPFVFICETPSELLSAVAQIRGEDAAMRHQRLLFAEKLRELHSFDTRAAQLEKHIAAILA